MIHKVNSYFIFDTESKTLSHTEKKHEAVTLSNNAAKVLIYFLNSPGEVISRNELFSAVWEVNENLASNASLNNYISELRKAFSEVGLPRDSLKTIPRHGFIFEGSSEVITTMPSGIKTSSINTFEIKHKKFLTNTKKSIAIVIFLFLASGLTLIPLNKEDIQKLNHIYTNKLCDIYNLSNNEKDIAFIKKEIASIDINCTMSKRDIFYNEGRFYNETHYFTLLSVCDKGEGNTYTNCVNVRKASYK